MEQTNMSPASILLVDDEMLIRKSFTRELQAEGFAVTAVANGQEAVDAVGKDGYDLVITDLNMPVVDGFGVLRAVKQLAPQTCVIILTGFGDTRSAIDALRLGADEFTLKPCDIDELVFRIRRCLEKKSLLRLLAARNRHLEEEMNRRRQVEWQLRDSENRFRLALDAASNGVWDHNLVTGEVFHGANWLTTLGFEGKDHRLDQCSLESLVHPDDRDRVLARRQEHLEGKTERYEVACRLRTNSGAWRWILSRGQVVARDEQGRALRFIGTITDITRLKEAEAELKRHRAELERRVEERTAELSASNVALTVLLKKREDDRKKQAEQVLANAARLVDPFVERLSESGLPQQPQTLLDILRTNINELTSPLAGNLSTQVDQLTPAELQIANMVKQGKRSREIAEIMRLSPGTVNVHRKNIRKKLGIAHRKTSLHTVLSVKS